MFPADAKNTSLQEYGKTSRQAIGSHMEKCDKSAVILSNEDAILSYNNLKVRNKPAYFGENVIQETLMGYKFCGYFPPNIFQRSKSYFQAGIVEWWQKHFRWSLMIKSRVEEIKIINQKGNNDTLRDGSTGKGGVYILACIPAFGLTFAVLMFVTLDSNIPFWIWSLLQRFTASATKVKLFKNSKRT